MQRETCKTKIASGVGDVRNIEIAFTSTITTGGLLYPSSDVVHTVTANYIIVNELEKTEEFKLAPS